MKTNSLILRFCLIFLVIIPLQLSAQKYMWMSAGSLHNWFSEMGCEIEVGRSSAANQQDGLQWPAILPYQDMQAAKGFWIAADNFTDQRGDFYEKRVITVGPRSRGFSEFYPLQLDMVSRFDPPTVFVDGVLSFDKSIDSHPSDPELVSDRMIINKVNTLLGITMERKIMQWSANGHDNYMIYDHTFTNTGNIDYDEEIELENQTVEGLRFFWQYRWAACFQTRYIVGNGTGWGMNTMHDARGDGPINPNQYGDPADEREYNGKQIRTQFAWHGYFPDKVVNYDNIGGPIWRVYAPYVADYDTIGRLGATQFIGILTLHADTDANDPTDDPTQPYTTGWYGSDLPETGPNSDPFNIEEMNDRYDWIDYGHMNPRHAWAVEASGDFAKQKGNPNIAIGAPRDGKPGGFSAGNGYGPYTLGPGESVRIVLAEAVNGLSTKTAIDVGRKHKQGAIDDLEKNQIVMTGKDSLFKTFRNAIDNFQADYQIDNPPAPPKLFQVSGGGDRISIDWDVNDEPGLAGFNIYRNRGEYDNPLEPPVLIASLPGDARNFDDLTPLRGVAYYYYITSVGDNGFESSRYYTQTYDPAFLKRPQGTSMDNIRVVPNPYIVSSSSNRLRFPGEGDKLAFFNVPGQCRIKIYTETGELVNTIEHTDGSGDEYWKAVTSSNQVVVSGLYIAHIEVTADIPDPSGDGLLYEKGQTKIIKFVIIR